MIYHAMYCPLGVPIDTIIFCFISYNQSTLPKQYSKIVHMFDPISALHTNLP
jgi:hypothetical protein